MTASTKHSQKASAYVEDLNVLQGLCWTVETISMVQAGNIEQNDKPAQDYTACRNHCKQVCLTDVEGLAVMNLMSIRRAMHAKKTVLGCLIIESVQSHSCIRGLRYERLALGSSVKPLRQLPYLRQAASCEPRKVRYTAATLYCRRPSWISMLRASCNSKFDDCQTSAATTQAGCSKASVAAGAVDAAHTSAKHL